MLAIGFRCAAKKGEKKKREKDRRIYHFLTQREILKLRDRTNFLFVGTHARHERPRRKYNNYIDNDSSALARSKEEL